MTAVSPPELPTLSWRSRYGYLSPFLKKQRLTILQALGCTVGFTAFWPALAWLPGELADPIGAGDLGAIAWADVKRLQEMLEANGIDYSAGE